MKENNDNRIQWIDTSKGIGILLVIIGHMAIPLNFVHSFIVSFHMPLFFVLAGVTYKQRTIKEYIIRRSKALLIPYFALGLTLVPYWVICMGKVNYNDAIWDCIKGLLLGNAGGHLWFLPALFVASLMLYFLTTLLEYNGGPRWKSKVLVVVGILLFALNGIATDIKLPWQIMSACGNLIFMILGISVFRRYSEKINQISLARSITYVVIWVIAYAVYWNYAEDINELEIFEIALKLLFASVGTLAIVIVSQKLNLRSLQYLGKNSMVLYMYHFPVFGLIQKVYMRFVSQNIDTWQFLTIEFVCALTILVVFVEIFNRTRLRVLLGKF